MSIDRNARARTPWRAEPWHSDEIEFADAMLGTFYAIHWRDDEYEGELAFTQGPQARANAEFIVAACNDHDRLKSLESAVKGVLAQKADDVCWRDVYAELATLVGVEFDPELLPRERFLGNCAHFYDCLKSGEPYKTPEACEHGVLDGDFCEACNAEYKRAIAEHDREVES